MTAKPARPSVRISADDVSRIRRAQDVLKNDPATAQQWYNRARYSAANEMRHETPEGPAPYPSDVIVIWESLGGKIEIDAILTVVSRRDSP